MPPTSTKTPKSRSCVTRPRFTSPIASEPRVSPGDASATLHTPYRADDRDVPAGPARLWIASLDLPEPAEAYLARHGFPIRYSYAPGPWPISAYQTVYADSPGSAEMPSAGRAFTLPLLRSLERKGVEIARLLLHTGVSSLEAHEPP